MKKPKLSLGQYVVLNLGSRNVSVYYINLQDA